MRITMEPYEALPCELRVFEINGVRANMGDFGKTVSEPDGEYGCADNYFEAYATPKEGILAKYSMTMDEYKLVCEELEDMLRVGSCGWCS